MSCQHSKVEWRGGFSFIGKYYCTACGLGINPFVQHKRQGHDHVYFKKEYAELLREAVSLLDADNLKLWEAANESRKII